MATIVSLHLTSATPPPARPQKFPLPPYRTNRRTPSSKNALSQRRPITAPATKNPITSGFAPVTKTQLQRIFPYRLVYHSEAPPSHLKPRCQSLKEDQGYVHSKSTSFSLPQEKAEEEEVSIVAPSPSPTPPALHPIKDTPPPSRNQSSKRGPSENDGKLFYYHYLPYNKMTTAEKKLLFQLKDLRDDDQLKDFLFKRRQNQPQWAKSVPLRLAYHTAEISQHYRHRQGKQWNMHDVCPQVSHLDDAPPPQHSAPNRLQSPFPSQINATSIHLFPNHEDDDSACSEDRTQVKLLGSTSNEVLRFTSIDDGVNLHKAKQVQALNDNLTNEEEFYAETDTLIGINEDDCSSLSDNQQEDEGHDERKVNIIPRLSPDHLMRSTSQSKRRKTAGDITTNNFQKRNAILREQMEIFVDWIHVERLKKLENRRCRTAKPTYRNFSELLRQKHLEEASNYNIQTTPKDLHDTPANASSSLDPRASVAEGSSVTPNDLVKIWETLRIH